MFIHTIVSDEYSLNSSNHKQPFTINEQFATMNVAMFLNIHPT